MPKRCLQTLLASLTSALDRPPQVSAALAQLSEDAWFDLQFEPEVARERYNLSLPTFPPDDVQLRFTGLSARDNLLQARSFYEYAIARSQLRQAANPRILDFGGGWGRVSRFFLRDAPARRITVADCLTDSIHWLRETRNPCDIRKNDVLPPIRGLSRGFHLIYAYSVFSHLSPVSTRTWLDYLIGLLRPGGWLVITTMARAFLDHLAGPGRDTLTNEYGGLLPAPEVMQARYGQGEVQFYPTGGGGELASSFYGITLLPRRYFLENYGSIFVEFTEEVPRVNQAVIALRKTPINATPDTARSKGYPGER